MNQQLALTSYGRPDSAQTGAQAHADQEAAALIRDLRKITRRLQSPRTLNHPHVRAALGQFDNELATALGQGRGRHRLHGGNRHAVSDPLALNTSAEFVTALRHYRVSSGNISFRQMAARARHVVPHSTMCMALNSENLPPLKVVIAIVVGCGGNVADQERFAAAWHFLSRTRAHVP